MAGETGEGGPGEGAMNFKAPDDESGGDDRKKAIERLKLIKKDRRNENSMQQFGITHEEIDNPDSASDNESGGYDRKKAIERLRDMPKDRRTNH